MFNGTSTNDLFEEYLNKGLCQEHLKEFSQDISHEQSCEFQRKILLFVRLRLLDPLLFGKPCVCDNITSLYLRIPVFERYISVQKVWNDDPSVEAKSLIMTLDSVAVYLICYLSKICCVGALFVKKLGELTTKNDEILFLDKLINSKSLDESDVCRLTPIILKNFEGYHENFLRICYSSCLLLVRYTSKELKLLKLVDILEGLEEELKRTTMKYEIFKISGSNACKEERFQDAVQDYTSALSINCYSFDALSSRAEAYIKLKNYLAAEMDSYMSIAINPQWCKGYCQLSFALFHQKLYYKTYCVAKYGLTNCTNASYGNYEALESIKAQADIKRMQLQTGNISQMDNVSHETNNPKGSDPVKNPSGPVVSSAMAKLDAYLADKCETSGSSKLLSSNHELRSRKSSFELLRRVQKRMSAYYKKKAITGKNKILEVCPNVGGLTCEELYELTCKAGGFDDDEISSEALEVPEKVCSKEKKELSKLTCKAGGFDDDEISSELDFIEDDASCNKSSSEVMIQTSEEELTEEFHSKALEVPEKVCSKEKKELSKESDDIKLEKIRSLLKEGSEAILDSCSDLAARLFRESLDDIKTFPELLGFKECDVVCIKYAYGSACCKSGGYEDLQKSIAVFKEIIDEHKSIIFPASYYGLGLAYRKLNRFKDALAYLKIVQDILEKGIRFKVYRWPGINASISETKPENLESVVNELIEECKNPPAPDAVCRYDECSFQPSIYYNDPYFKGFITIACSEQCSLQYHQQCWKALKAAKSRSDKEFLEKDCFTPDCAGMLVKVQIIDKVGNKEKVFISSEMKKPQKQKKHKFEKKLDHKEEKKKKRHDSKSDKLEASVSANEEVVCADASSNVQPEVEAVTIKSNVAANDKPSDVPATILSVSAEPFYILKKTSIPNDNYQKTTTKQKERKKPKDKTLSVAEFCGNFDNSCTEYQKRLNQMHHNEGYAFGNFAWSGYTEITPSSSSCEPFKTPDVMMGNEKTLVEEVFDPFDGHYSIKKSEETYEMLSVDKNSKAAEHSYAELSPNVDVNDNIRKNIYSYLEDLLCLNGPLRIDDAILNDELKNFPSEANIIIADSGGLAEFLKKNIRFAVVGDAYVCVVDDVVAAYKMRNNSPLQLEHSNFEILENDQTPHEQKVYSNISSLNPEAVEYQPAVSSCVSVDLKTDAHFNNINAVNQKAFNFNNNNDANNKSDLLMSVVSKLRQPLLVDDDTQDQNLNCNENMSIFSSNESSGAALNHVSSDINSSNYIEIPELSDVEQPTNIDIAKEWQNLINSYFSDEVKPYHSVIASHLKPYAIVELPKKHNRAIQTEKCEMISRATMKTDDELHNLLLLSQSLLDEKQKFTYENDQLKQNLESAMNSATKSQKRASLELSNLRKDLEDTVRSFEEENKTFRKKEMRWENEQKHMTESLNKAYEDANEQKIQINSLISDTENLKATIKLLESQVTSAEALKSAQDIKVSSLIESIENLKKENLHLEKRARNSELRILLLKKEEALKRIDKKNSEAALKMKELKDGVSLISGNIHPVYIKNIETLLSQIATYINKLAVIRVNFMVNIDEQIKEVQNGLPLSELKPLEMKDLPEIPSWSSPYPIPNVGSFLPPLGISQQIQMDPNFHPALQNQVQIMNLHTNSVINNQSSNLVNKNVTATENASKNTELAVRPKSLPVVHKLPPGIGITEVKNVHPNSSVQSSSALSMKVCNSQLSVNKEKREASVESNASTSSSKDSVISSKSSSNGSKSEKLAEELSLELGYGAKGDSHNKNSVAFSSKLQPNTKPPESKNSYEKLLIKLQSKYPEYTQVQLISFVKEYRSKREGKLSGLTMDNIINNVSSLIESKKAERNMATVETGTKGRCTSNKILVNKKLVSESKPKEPENDSKPQRKCAWNVKNEETKQWSGDNIDNNCIICFEDMTPKTAYKVDCGHSFHLLCIREWLNKKSDCPVCRIHLLLPEDYPSLS